MPQPQVWLHFLRHPSRFPSPSPPFSSISFSPAQFIAQPNPNKALASVKQGALHKKVMSASNADRRDSVLRAFDRVCWCMQAWMCECCVCVSLWPSLHQQTVFSGLRRCLWSDLMGAISQSNSPARRRMASWNREGWQRSTSTFSGWQKQLMTAYKLSGATTVHFIVLNRLLSNIIIKWFNSCTSKQKF